MSEFNRGDNSQFNFDPAPVFPGPKQEKKRKFLRPLGVIAVALSGAIVGGIVGASVFSFSFLSLTRPAPVVVNDVEQVNWVTGAAANASPSVVTISVVSDLGSGSGSGVVLTKDGYILTNAHVVTLSGQTEDAVITVRTWDGFVYRATIVGTDSTYDLAVIKIKSAMDLKPMEFADSQNLNVGENVVAIGAPLGLSSTVTEGIISALNRTIQVASSEINEEGGLQFWTGSGSAPISLQVIQTDAAINPGNSGGALVNQDGELVGINVAIATAGSGEAGSIGVGFAIPSNTAFRIAQEIIDSGSASHGLLGAMVRDFSEEDSSFSTGAYVEEVTEGGAAQNAGIQSGDIITKFAGTEVASAADLTALVRAQPAGAEVELELTRDGEKLTFQVVLGNSADLN
jgi:putative serine protease PepD